MRSSIIVGIDPGTITGYAEWDVSGQCLLMVSSFSVHEAMRAVVARKDATQELLVIFEDARQRKCFRRMDALTKKYGNGVREGAGAAKRDAKIWAQFLADNNIQNIAQRPGVTPTKRTSEWFKKVTGWSGRTNEHARDAALLVYGINGQRADVLMATARRAA